MVPGEAWFRTRLPSQTLVALMRRKSGNRTFQTVVQAFRRISRDLFVLWWLYSADSAVGNNSRVRFLTTPLVCFIDDHPQAFFLFLFFLWAGLNDLLSTALSELTQEFFEGKKGHLISDSYQGLEV